MELNSIVAPILETPDIQSPKFHIEAVSPKLTERYRVAYTLLLFANVERDNALSV
jgi:hypothetical protein